MSSCFACTHTARLQSGRNQHCWHMRQAGDASAGAAGFAAGLDFAIPPLSYSKPPCMAHGNMLSNGKPKVSPAWGYLLSVVKHHRTASL